MPKNIQHVPFFPLNLLLLPSEVTALHIFEPRYKQLINESVALNRKFGIPFFDKVNTQQFGSYVRVVEVLKEYSNGNLDVTVECVENFKMTHYEHVFAPKLYPAGTINPLPKYQNKEVSFDLQELFTEYLNLSTLQQVELFQVRNYSLTEIAADLKLDIKEKLAFLKKPSFKSKEDYVFEKIRLLIFLFRQERQVENNFYLN